MKTLRATSMTLEVAHRGLDGAVHGHSLNVEVWTEAAIDLDAWQGQVREACTPMEGLLEDTIAGRTFEQLGEAIMHAMPQACRVMVRLPSRGHSVEISR